MIIAQAAEAAKSTFNWAEYGLQGLVIGALFTILVLGFRYWMTERKEFLETIKDTTTEFSTTVDQISERHNQTTKEISDQFVELHREQANTIQTFHRETLERLANKNQNKGT